jgi:hypothetical protein
VTVEPFNVFDEDEEMAKALQLSLMENIPASVPNTASEPSIANIGSSSASNPINESVNTGRGPLFLTLLTYDSRLQCIAENWRKVFTLPVY